MYSSFGLRNPIESRPLETAQIFLAPDPNMASTIGMVTSWFHALFSKCRKSHHKQCDHTSYIWLPHDLLMDRQSPNQQLPAPFKIQRHFSNYEDPNDSRYSRLPLMCKIQVNSRAVLRYIPCIFTSVRVFPEFEQKHITKYLLHVADDISLLARATEINNDFFNTSLRLRLLWNSGVKEQAFSSGDRYFGTGNETERATQFIRHQAGLPPYEKSSYYSRDFDRSIAPIISLAKIIDAACRLKSDKKSISDFDWISLYESNIDLKPVYDILQLIQNEADNDDFRFAVDKDIRFGGGLDLPLWPHEHCISGAITRELYGYINTDWTQENLSTEEKQFIIREMVDDRFDLEELPVSFSHNYKALDIINHAYSACMEQYPSKENEETSIGWPLRAGVWDYHALLCTLNSIDQDSVNNIRICMQVAARAVLRVIPLWLSGLGSLILSYRFSEHGDPEFCDNVVEKCLNAINSWRVVFGGDATLDEMNEARDYMIGEMEAIDLSALTNLSRLLQLPDLAKNFMTHRTEKYIFIQYNFRRERRMSESQIIRELGLLNFNRYHRGLSLCHRAVHIVSKMAVCSIDCKYDDDMRKRFTSSALDVIDLSASGMWSLAREYYIENCVYEEREEKISAESELAAFWRGVQADIHAAGGWRKPLWSPSYRRDFVWKYSALGGKFDRFRYTNDKLLPFTIMRENEETIFAHSKLDFIAG